MSQQLNVLLVEDEPGIREGLASFLKLKGMRVTTAGSQRTGLVALAAETFDVVVTDWRLGDGLGKDIVRQSCVPVIVASGVPEEIELDPDEYPDVSVIQKPVMPADLVAKVEELGSMAPLLEVSEPAAGSDPDLPVDARDRVALLVALCGDPGPRIVDDGSVVTFEAVLDRESCDRVESDLQQLEDICGDVRMLPRGQGAALHARFYRDGRPDDSTIVVGAFEPWPDAASLAVDFDRADCSPARFLKLVEQRRESVQRGRSVSFLNVPGHLRLCLEVLGNAHDMPKRGKVGPRLPLVLAELWSSCDLATSDVTGSHGCGGSP